MTKSFILETMEVPDGNGGTMIINKKDYDPAKHAEKPAAKPAAPKRKAAKK